MEPSRLQEWLSGIRAAKTKNLVLKIGSLQAQFGKRSSKKKTHIIGMQLERDWQVEVCF